MATVLEAPTRGKQEKNGHGSGHAAPVADERTVPDAGEQPDQPAQKKRGLSPVARGIAALFVLGVLSAAGVVGANKLHYSQTHVNTDDAYITGNLVNVSPIIGGTLSQLQVDEGDAVKKGQLIARLDDSSEQAALRQAQAAYAAALTQVPQAESSLQFEEQSTQAGIARAEAAIGAQRARTVGATQQVSLTINTVRNQVAEAESRLAAAQAQAEQAQAQVMTAQAGVSAAQQAVLTAQRNAAAVAAHIQAAQADAQRTAKDVERYGELAAEQAISQQQYEAAQAAATSSEAALVAAREQAAEAQSQVNQAREGVRQAQAQLNAARQAAAAARKQVQVARADVALAQANGTQVGIQQTNVTASAQQTGQAEADLSAALANREQVDLRRKQVATAKAQAEQARAALENAKVAERNTYIYAPADGTVVKKTANVGASLSPGQNIITMTQGDTVWVTANFKETQLKGVRPGEPAKVEVDSFPGRVFKGRVQSVNEATGSAISLLPADNASGNFTKVVQRVPVRIQLVPAKRGDDPKYAHADEIANLRQGMSVTATIDLR